MRSTGICGGGPMSDLQLYIWIVVLLSGIATYVWRAAAVAIAGRVGPTSEAFRLFACVAYAMVAGLISRMIILPSGVLAETPLAYRLIGTGVALAVYFGFKRNLPFGVFAGVGVFALLITLLS